MVLLFSRKYYREYIEAFTMSTSQERAIRRHRQRLKRRGLKRVEVEAAESDAVLIRKLARILRKGGESAEWTRSQLVALVAADGPGLKALLAAAPLEGIRISRSVDRGRKIDL
jgi:hypothetical protein